MRAETLVCVFGAADQLLALTFKISPKTKCGIATRTHPRTTGRETRFLALIRRVLNMHTQG